MGHCNLCTAAMSPPRHTTIVILLIKRHPRFRAADSRPPPSHSLLLILCPAQRRRKIWDLSTPLDSHEKQHARGCESTRHRPTWCDAWHREQCHSTASIEYDHDLDCIRPARAARCRHLPAAANISGLDITRKERAYFFRPLCVAFLHTSPIGMPRAAAKIWARGLHIPL